jgi:hypothetical protein
MRTSMISTRVAAVAAAAATIAAATTLATPASASVNRQPTPAPDAVRWHQVTTNGQLNFADVGLAVGSHNVLNVIWATAVTSGGHAKIMDTPVNFSGTVGRAVTIASGGFMFGYPDATVTRTKINTIWNGMLTSSLTSPQGGFISSRGIGGGAWSKPAVIPPLSAQPEDSQPDTAVTGSDGKPWVAFPGGGDDSLVLDHVAHPEHQLPPTTCCVLWPGLAVDSSNGATWVAYWSDAANHIGVFARRLNQDGTAAGPALRLPGSVTKGETPELNERIAITGRGQHRAGVYAAYITGWPTALHVNLVRVGHKTPARLASTSAARQFFGVAVSANPAGGLWVAWFSGGSRPGLTIRESNSSVTKFGRARGVALPSGTSTIWKVYIKAVGSKLDIVALLTRHGKIAYWTTQAR